MWIKLCRSLLGLGPACVTCSSEEVKAPSAPVQNGVGGAEWALAASKHVLLMPVPSPAGEVWAAQSPQQVKAHCSQAALEPVSVCQRQGIPTLATLKSFSLQLLNGSCILEAVGRPKPSRQRPAYCKLGSITPCSAGWGTDLALAGRGWREWKMCKEQHD